MLLDNQLQDKLLNKPDLSGSGMRSASGTAKHYALHDGTRRWVYVDTMTPSGPMAVHDRRCDNSHRCAVYSSTLTTWTLWQQLWD
jgi:hypothetical protein